MFPHAYRRQSLRRQSTQYKYLNEADYHDEYCCRKMMKNNHSSTDKTEYRSIIELRNNVVCMFIFVKMQSCKTQVGTGLYLLTEMARFGFNGL